MCENIEKKNDFHLHENGHEGETHFHMNGFPRRLILTQRQRVTREWPIATTSQLERSVSVLPVNLLQITSLMIIHKCRSHRT